MNKEIELLNSPIPIERFDLNGRWYTPLEEWWEENYDDLIHVYPQLLTETGGRPFKQSSTTILDMISKGYGFNKWLGDSLSYRHAMDYANERADIGTIVHEMIWQLVLGNEINFENPWLDEDNEKIIELNDEHIKYMMSFMAWWEACKPEPLACEVAMFGSEYAGTADFVGTLLNPKTEKREMWLIDWKTGNDYPDHQLQITSYRKLWEELFDIPIDHIGGLYLKSGWRKEPKFAFKKYKYIPEVWGNALEVYRWWAKDPQPKFPQELPKTMNLYKEKEDGKPNQV